ncbi:DUF7701 domain-containing protein [Streptomyces daliensis]|uniref:DUF7701 domain-containing protein n=1 Tax=Streptomyces daliensis TaxID=299421 RepID=A0A8T4IJ52_9ACTN|nr:hypothetical protein [Streptomyces daliensis]
MTYLHDDARLIRSHLSSQARPPEDSDALFLLYAVLMRAKGEHVTEVDVHDAWAAWMATRNLGHPALVPFESLDTSAQSQDLPYVQAIHSAARDRRATRNP